MMTSNARFCDNQTDEQQLTSINPNGDHIYLGPSGTMEDNDISLVLIVLAKISLKILFVELSLARDIATLIIINLVTRQQTQQSIMLLLFDS